MGYFIFLSEKFLLRRVKGLLAAGTSSDCSCCVDENVCKVVWTGNKMFKKQFSFCLKSVWWHIYGFFNNLCMQSIALVFNVWWFWNIIERGKVFWASLHQVYLLELSTSVTWTLVISFMYVHVVLCRFIFFLHDSLLLLVFVVVEDPLLKKRKNNR